MSKHHFIFFNDFTYRITFPTKVSNVCYLFIEFVQSLQVSEDIADEMIEKYFPNWFEQNVSV